ncbi:LamG domain-containing protein [Candidatus Parcubacteria bacterium]|nr:LamG domain-containing protein [Candidatus Parcubacteria bacterium]
MKDKILSKNINIFCKLFILPIMILAGFFIVHSNAQAAEPVNSTDLAIWHAEPVNSTDLAIWHFDENTGSIAYDATDNHNDLTWKHNPWGGGRTTPDKAEGKWDIGIAFKQAEEHFLQTFSPLIEFPNGLTIGAWIKTDLVSTYDARFLWLGNTINYAPKNQFMLTVYNGKIKFDLKQNNTWQTQMLSNTIVNNNQWHFVTVRFNTIDLTTALFIDGQKQAEQSFELPIPALEIISLGMRECGSGSEYNFKGVIDDVWLKTASLTDEQIAEIYQSNSPYKADVELPALAEVETQAYYNFNENSGNIAHDLSGNSYDLKWSYNPWSGDSTPRWVSGKFSSAVNFQKTEDLFSYDFSSDLEFPNGVSLGIWTKTQASSSPAGRIVWIGNTFNHYGLPDNHFTLREQDGQAMLNMSFGNRWYSIISNFLINDNKWHFLAITIDPRPYNHKIKLYVDGQLEGEKFYPYPAPYAAMINIGFREDYYCHEQCNFDGDIDDLFILSSVISDDDVKQIYQSNQAFVWPIENEIDPLILKYEPILYLHPNETYQPMNVEAYVNHCSLWDSHGAAPDELLKTESSLNPVTLDDLNFTGIDSSKYYLQFSQNLADKIPDADKAKVEYQQIVDNGEVKYTYYVRKMIDTVEETGEEYIVLQYWFFYAMSDFGVHVEKGNIHEGDWEVVMVFLDKEEEPKYVAHSVHYNRGEEGFPGFQYNSVRNNWDSSELNKEGTHIFSLVGLGSHANYPNNGDNGIHNVPVISDDLTSFEGLCIDQENWQKRFVFEKNNFPGWLVNYRGWWGVYNGILGSTGTNPPYYTLYNKFNEPIEWAGIDKIGKLEVLTEGQYAFEFAKQNTKIAFNKVVDKGTVFLVDLHDEIVQIGENLKNIAFLPHFWDIESSLENDTFEAEVSFAYDTEETEAMGIEEEYLAVFLYNEDNKIWEKIPSVTDISNKVISFFTTHFSRYALGAELWQDISEEVKANKDWKRYDHKIGIKHINARVKNKTKANIFGDIRLIIKDINKEDVFLVNNTATTSEGYPYIEIKANDLYNHCIFTGDEEDIPEDLNKKGWLKKIIKKKMIRKKPLNRKLCEKIINKYPEIEEKLEYTLLPHHHTKPIKLEFSLPIKKTKTIKYHGKEITIYIPEFRKFKFEVEVMNKVVGWE